MYFHVRLILQDLGISLPHEDGFSKVKNSYMKSAYYSVCDGYSVNADETWMHEDCFYTTDYAIFGHEVKAKKGLHKTILHNGYSRGPGALQERELKR